MLHRQKIALKKAEPSDIDEMSDMGWHWRGAQIIGTWPSYNILLQSVRTIQEQKRAL